MVEFKVEDSPSQTENIVYTVNKTPWPVTNRDAFIRSELSADANGVVTSTLTGVPDFKAGNDDYIRMPELKGAWTFAPMEAGMVEVTYQVHANPGGSLPNWLVNAIVIETPMNTLQNLHDVIHNEKYQGKTYAFIDQAKAAAEMAVETVVSEAVAIETMTAK